MLKDRTDLCFVNLLAFWYSHQNLYVYWQGHCSDKLCVGDGTRQSGVLVAYLFTPFVRPLISAIMQSRLRRNMGVMFANLFACANDIQAHTILIKLLDMRCTEQTTTTVTSLAPRRASNKTQRRIRSLLSRNIVS